MITIYHDAVFYGEVGVCHWAITNFSPAFLIYLLIWAKKNNLVFKWSLLNAPLHG